MKHITSENSWQGWRNHRNSIGSVFAATASGVVSLRVLLVLVTALLTHNTAAQDLPPDERREPVVAESLDAPAPPGIRPGGTIAQEFKSPFIPPEVKSMARPARN